MPKCKAITKTGEPCKNFAVEGSDFCVFHGGTEGRRTGFSSVDFAQGQVVTRKKIGYYALVGREDRLSLRPRTDKLKTYEEYYEDGGIVSTAIDSMVNVAVGNGFQLIDRESGNSESDSVKIIENLHERINLSEVFEKVFRSILIFGFAWGELVVRDTDVIGVNFFPPYELEVERDENTGFITKYKQVKGNDDIATWEKTTDKRSDKNIENIIFITRGNLYSEIFGKSLIGKVYEEAEDRDVTRKNMTAVSEFVAYPFRVVKVGNNEYPASREGVTNVADQVEELEPGDWLVTRHNVEFQFEAPKAPPAMQETFEQQTRSLVVSLGVPSLYTSFSDIDAQTLKEIRSIFNSTIRTMQNSVAFQIQDTLIKRQLNLKNIPTIRHPHPVIISWNPLTVSVLSILELTQLMTAGAISISEARRMLESMGYGLLRGDEFKKEQKAMGTLQNPKQSHPSEDDPEKAPNDGNQPRKETDDPKTKKPSDTPKIEKPQPNSPKMNFQQWLEGIRVLKEIDKKEAHGLLMKELVNGFDFNNTEYKQVEEPTTREMEHNLNLNITTEPLKLEKDIITIESKPLEVDINVVNPETGETELIDDKKLTEKAKLELIEKMKKRLDLNE